MKYQTVLIGALSGTYAFAAPCTSWGQEPESQRIEMESITVTANMMEEDIQDVPQSITVIDEVVLEEKGIRDVVDLIGEVPNMSVQPQHGAAVNFRGLNNSMFTSNNPVVIYIDGIPYSDRYGFDASFANVDRIEVLRGPQGTLYGKDAIGGVIKIVTQDPENAWSVKAGAEYGSFDFMRGWFNASGALVEDTLFAGVNGQYWQDDGWIENTLAGMDKDANPEEDRRVSGYLLYKPTARTSIKLTLSNDYHENHWNNGYGLPSGATIDDFDRDDAEKVAFDVPTYEEYESNAQSLKITHDFGPVTLTSVTSHRLLKTEGQYDADFGNDPLYAGLTQFNDTELDTYTQELRLSNDSESGIRWVGGLYFDTEERNQGPYGQQFPNYDPQTYAFIGNYEMNAVSVSNNDTYALFGQIIAPIGDRIELTAGARWQYIEKEIDLDTFYLPVGMSGSPYYHFEGDKSWDAFLPKLALSYRLDDAWTTYVSYSQGYMPGGFNYFATAGTAEDNSFEPQRSTNYEVGIKGDLDRFRIAASLFYMDITDIHVYKAVGTMYLGDNAKKAHSQGAELEVSWLPTSNLELTGAFGVIDAEYDDYDAGGGIVYDGEKIQNTPSYTASLGVAWFHPKGAYSRLDLKSQGNVYFYDDANKEFVEQDGYTTLDARIGYQFDGWDLYAYGKNLTDEGYITTFISNSSLALATFGEPRTFGIGVRHHF
ncbi:TonB-dependent receptor [Imhoffiella purpurea]|uniref:TonB-dependent receptor n=1 Tax=Imhoffiella purpurea TaxID=1249627 RepID=W9VHU7_9GAMM|nr:TonB-dependent receptor [Imhoffiella purpurea]EXJ15622.1 TonB-dependent receptor [Imhoffiella purpurea]